MSAIPNWMPKVVIGLMLAGMTASVAWQARVFMQAKEQSSQPQALPASSSASSPQTPQIALGELDLFGVRSEAAPVVVQTADLPVTNLRLVLRGVAAASDSKPASALIEGPDQETLTYKVGATLPGNAKLHAVQIASVILNREGRLENLRFPEETPIEGVHSLADSAPDYSNESYAPPDGMDPSQYEEYMPPDEPVQAYSEPMSTPDQLNEAQKEEIKARLQELRERLRSGYQ